MDCEFCNNTFKTVSSLNYHKTHAKYCLKKQNKTNNELKCEYCTKSFSSKHWLNQHKNRCGENINNIQKLNSLLILENNNLKLINEMLETRLSDQQEKYESQISNLQNIAISAVRRPKNTQINNYIQQLRPLTEEHLTKNVRHLTIDHILKGPEGYAQYALEYPLKDRVLCVDYSRRKVKFKDTEGNIITDPEMSNLATKFFNSIKNKNKELIVEYGDKLKENFGDEVDTIVKIFDYKTGVERSSDGERTDFHHDFVRQVCSLSIKE
jgi:hypothetical protein